jgi:hypothetical protein
MKKCFTLCFNILGPTREAVLEFLNSRPEILNWYTVLPGQVFVVSDRSAHDLSALLRARFSPFFFFVAEINPYTINGLLPTAAWEFVNQPTSSGRWIEQPPASLPPLPPSLLKSLAGLLGGSGEPSDPSSKKVSPPPPTRDRK